MKSKSIVLKPGADDQKAIPMRPEARVIKRQFTEQPRPAVSTDYRALAPKDAYLEELNRIKVEIEQARDELRRLKTAPRQHTVEQDSFAFFDEDTLDGEGAEDILEYIEDPGYESEFDRQQAAELIQAAEQDAVGIRAQAVAEAEELRQQSKNEGYLEGFNKGYEEAVTEFKRVNDPLANKLAELVDSLSSFEQDRVKQNEHELVELALGIASKVIGQELSAKPEAIVKMLADAVVQNHSEDYIRITLAEDLLPVDVKASAKVKKLLEELGANITVLTDAKAPAGKIQMETPKGIIDMSVDTQLANIREILGGE